MKVVEVMVKVYFTEDKTEKSGLRFEYLKVGNSQGIPIPKDKPAPRRLVQTLSQEAGYILKPETRPEGEEVPLSEDDGPA